MNEQQVSAALAEWIADELSIAPESTYAYPVATKLGPLPDVAAIVDRKRLAYAQTLVDVFPYLELQQHQLVRVFECSASVMVEVQQTEDSAKAKFEQLQGYGAAIEVALLDDPTLGERVPFASPFLVVDYSPVFGETEDGTRGRLVTIECVIGELIDEPDEFLQQ